MAGRLHSHTRKKGGRTAYRLGSGESFGWATIQPILPAQPRSSLTAVLSARERMNAICRNHLLKTLEVLAELWKNINITADHGGGSAICVVERLRCSCRFKW